MYVYILIFLKIAYKKIKIFSDLENCYFLLFLLDVLFSKDWEVQECS